MSFQKPHFPVLNFAHRSYKHPSHTFRLLSRPNTVQKTFYYLEKTAPRVNIQKNSSVRTTFSARDTQESNVSPFTSTTFRRTHASRCINAKSGWRQVPLCRLLEHDKGVKSNDSAVARNELSAGKHSEHCANEGWISFVILGVFL